MFMFRIRHGNSFSLLIAGGHAMMLTIRQSCVSCPGPPEMSGSVAARHIDKIPRSSFSHIVRRAPGSRHCRAAASVRTRLRVHATWKPVPTDCPDNNTGRRAPLLVRPPRSPHAPSEDRFALGDEAPTWAPEQRPLAQKKPADLHT